MTQPIRINAAQKKRFAELRTALEVWGEHEITNEPVLIKYVQFQLSKSPSWTLIDLTGATEKTGTFLGCNAVEALAALERIQSTLPVTHLPLPGCQEAALCALRDRRTKSRQEREDRYVQQLLQAVRDSSAASPAHPAGQLNTLTRPAQDALPATSQAPPLALAHGDSP
ncbi:MAG: hypothetical protein QX197_14220 [Methylococcaceae bacterium]